MAERLRLRPATSPGKGAEKSNGEKKEEKRKREGKERAGEIVTVETVREDRGKRLGMTPKGRGDAWERRAPVGRLRRVACRRVDRSLSVGLPLDRRASDQRNGHVRCL